MVDISMDLFLVKYLRSIGEVVLGIEHRALSMLGKCFHWSHSHSHSLIIGRLRGENGEKTLGQDFQGRMGQGDK
jgi:hypothetical protein